MYSRISSVTIVEELPFPSTEEIEVRFESEFGLPMARHHAERYCKENGVKVITRRPTEGRIATDKQNVVWHVTGLE